MKGRNSLLVVRSPIGNGREILGFGRFPDTIDPFSEPLQYLRRSNEERAPVADGVEHDPKLREPVEIRVGFTLANSVDQPPGRAPNLAHEPAELRTLRDFPCYI